MLKDDMKIPLYKNETLEDLQRSGFRMIQTRNGFRFGEDSVLLAALAARMYPVRKKLMVADLGAGCGAVSLLMAARMPGIRIWSLELDQHRTDCLERNILLNNLCDRLTAIRIDLKEISGSDAKSVFRDHLIEPSSCDLVAANPPYRRTSAATAMKWETADAEVKSRLLAVEEISLSIDQLAAAASRLLKPGGRFIVVHRPQRLPDLLAAMQRFGLEPQSIQVIESLPGRPPSRIIIVGRRQARSGGFKWLEPLTVCDSPGFYSDEAKLLYGHEPHLAQEQLMQGIEKMNIDWACGADGSAE